MVIDVTVIVALIDLIILLMYYYYYYYYFTVIIIFRPVMISVMSAVFGIHTVVGYCN